MTNEQIRLIWPDKPVNIEPDNSCFLHPLEQYGEGTNQLIHGDNLYVMEALLETHSESLDLVYIDPPFATGSDFSAFLEVGNSSVKQKRKRSVKSVAYQDKWKKGVSSYLSMMHHRLQFIHQLLKPTGCLFLHCDWRVSAYLRLILDEIFGIEHFVNEIIWSYKSGGSSKKRFSRKHDSIFFYAKSNKYKFFPQKEKSYNRKFKPYRFKNVEEFQDEIGWYTLVNRRDVWAIDMVGRTSSERVDYATQKPESLLEIIIKSCTEEGDLVADFFCGSGTTLAVANQLGRQWIGSDIGSLAIHTTRKRLLNQDAEFLLSGLKGSGNNQTELDWIKKAYPLKKKNSLVWSPGFNQIVEKKELESIIQQFKGKELYVLGWEWSSNTFSLQDKAFLNFIQLPTIQTLAKKQSLIFYQLPQIEVEILLKKRLLSITLKDFIYPDFAPDIEVENWSDFIDYWAVDWNFTGIFQPQFIVYRQPKQRDLSLKTSFTYKVKVEPTICIQVVDVLGLKSCYLKKVTIQ